MKNSAILFLILLFSVAAFSQENKPIEKNPLSSSVVEEIDEETGEFQKAVAVKNAAERIGSLQMFLEKFPESENKPRVLELIVSGRAEIAAEKLRSGEKDTGIELFKLAVKDAPTPISDELYTQVILQFPTNLFFSNQPDAAIEIAELIEKKIGDNPNQILGLAAFYIGTENAAEAVRLAQKAIAIEPNLPAAYQTLGLARRMNFELEDSAEAYRQALELDENSNISRRSLAEMKRATGKPVEAIALYKKILEIDASDTNALTGLILSYFDAGRESEAERQLRTSLELFPNNLTLLVGAAYWYAAHGQGAKAVELANQAVNIEPRYTWAHIALARGLIVEKRPLDAERVLLAARRYGDFPTLSYEIASARLAAGFYREAADELRRRFEIKDGEIMTNLGGRVLKQSDNFTDLLALERKASIFQPNAADNREYAAKLKSLLDLTQKLQNPEIDEMQISDAVDKFVAGSNSMKFHRQIYAANRLINEKKSLPKALELTRAAVKEVDSALNVASPSAAVLADELYDSRTLAASRGEFLFVPEVPTNTLSQIVRGRLEELAGRILLVENKPDEAVVRFRRAVSVLPKESSWWRANLWELGTALESANKPEEALDAYIKSYDSEQPSESKRFIIELLYRKVRGNLEGLDDLIGANPFPADPKLVKNNEQNKPPVKSVEKTTENIASTNDEITNSSMEIQENSTKETKIIPENVPLGIIKENSDNKSVKVTESIENTNKKIALPKENTLFEPVVIKVAKNPKISDSISEEDSAKPSAAEDDGNPENRKTKLPAIRGRIVNDDKIKPDEDKIEPCFIYVSQKNFSLINNGGSLNISVGIEGENDPKNLKVLVSSPKDIKVFYEPGFKSPDGYAVFIVKSVSENKGEYTVTFEAPCGTKEVFVKVR